MHTDRRLDDLNINDAEKANLVRTMIDEGKFSFVDESAKDLKVRLINDDGKDNTLIIECITDEEGELHWSHQRWEIVKYNGTVLDNTI